MHGADGGPALRRARAQRRNEKRQAAVDGFADPTVEGGTLVCCTTVGELMLFKKFFKQYDQAAFFLLVVVANAFALEVAKAAGAAAPPGLVVAFATFGVGSVFGSLAKSQLDTTVTPQVERVLSTASTVAGVLVFVVCFALTSPHFFDVGIEAGAAQLDASLHAYARKKRFELAEGTVVTPNAVAIGLGTVAGIAAGLAVAPAVRHARSLNLLASPPQWCAEHLASGLKNAVGPTVAKASFSLSMGVPLLWVVPIVGEEPPAWLRPCALAAVGLLQLAAFRPLVQAYLDSALVAWYELRHLTGVDHDKVVLTMKQKLDTTNFLVGKAALQLIAPPVLCLCAAAASRLTEYASVTALAQAVCLAFSATYGAVALGALYALSTGVMQA